MILKMFDESICDWILNHYSEINMMKEKNKLLIKRYSKKDNKENNS